MDGGRVSAAILRISGINVLKRRPGLGLWRGLRLRLRGQGIKSRRVYLLPAAALVLAFFVLPNLLNFIYGFTDWNTYREGIRFVGLQNFSDLSDTGELGPAITTTLVFAVFVMIAANVFALGLALALEESTWMNIVLRGLFFIPVLISSLAAGFVAKGILGSHGIVNAGLSSVSAMFGGPPIAWPWLGSPTFTLFVLGLVQAWKWGGIFMLVYIAGLKAIPSDLVEAARVEGANAWQAFRRVQMPMLGPAITFGVTLSFLGALNTFDVVMATTKGGPGRATQVLNMEVWFQISQGFFGYATAFGMIVAAIAIVAAVPMIAILRRREVEL